MREVLAAEPLRNYAAKANRALRTEARIQFVRTLHGPTGDIRDMTPREVMLNNMHYFMQGAFDWQKHLMDVVEQPVTKESAEAIAQAQREIDRYRNLASEDAYKVAPYIHPRLAAVVVGAGTGQNMADIIQELLDDIDARQREPKVIEHQPKREETS